MNGEPIFKGLFSFSSKRQRWDKYFLETATVIGSNSKCLSRQIGALLVRDKSIVSTGYNGPARGIPMCIDRAVDTGMLQVETPVCPRQALGFKTGEGLYLCIAVHAEVNTIANAARNGVNTMGCSLYLSGGILPCVNCMSTIINAGIVEVVVTDLTFYDESSKYVIQNSKVRIRDYKGTTL